jgi:acyl carrier protein
VSEDEIYAGLTEIFRDAFSDTGILLRPHTTAQDISGWDSLKMVSLIISAEERFGIKMRSREIDQLGSVGDFVKLIQAKAA